LDAFAQSLAISPSHLPSLAQAAPRYLDAGRFEDALKAYRNIQKLSGDSGTKEERAALLLNLGRAELGAGDGASAGKRFHKVLDLQAGSIDALEGLINVAAASSDWKEVLNLCNQLIKAAVDDLDATIRGYRRKSRVLEVHLERSDKSIPHWTKLLEYVPGDIEAEMMLGHAFLRQGDTTSALDHARAAQGEQDESMKPKTLATLLVCAAQAQEGELAEQAAEQLQDLTDKKTVDAARKAGEAADGKAGVKALRKAMQF